MAAGLSRERTGRAPGAEPGERPEPTERLGAVGERWGPGVPDPGSAPRAPHTGRAAPGRFSLCPPARSFLPRRHRRGGAARPPPAFVKGEALRCSPPPTSSPSPPSRPRRNSEYRGFHALYRIQRRSEVWKLHPGSGGGGEGGRIRPPPHSWTAWVRGTVGAAAVTAHLGGKASPVDQPQRMRFWG